jgi:hypothetical protein
MAVSKVTSSHVWALALACLLVVHLDVVQVQAARELTGKSGSCAVQGIDVTAALLLPCRAEVGLLGAIHIDVGAHKKGDACCKACESLLVEIKAKDSKKCQCDILNLTIENFLNLNLLDLVKVCVDPALIPVCVNL